MAAGALTWLVTPKAENVLIPVAVAVYGSALVPLPPGVAVVFFQLPFAYCITANDPAGLKAAAPSVEFHPNVTVTLLPPATSSLMLHCRFTTLEASATGLSKLFFTLTEKLSAVPA